VKALYGVRRAALVASVVVSAHCGSAPARTQWLVFVGTDAPVPQLGQQLLIEIIDSDGSVISPDDRRFIDASRTSAWPVSFGIVPDRLPSNPRLHVRLYRLDQAGSDGLPVGTALLDATATLPTPNGITRVAVPLSMTCFGVAPALASAQTCNPATGQLAPEPTLVAGVPGADALPSPGSWPPGVSVPCTGARTGMTCLAGGAFLLGSEQFLPNSSLSDPVPQHLVVVAPFALDTDEVTVGALRPLVVSGAISPPLVNNAATVPGDGTEFCTYLGAANASNDGAPANCLAWAEADQACRAMGKRLPTEAEWEYAARNLSEGSPYPWGNDSNVCADAIVARGVSPLGEPAECEPPGGTVPAGPLAGGAAIDATSLGIRNLGGNVAEWTADFFAPYASPCWSGDAPLTNPSCQSPSASHTVRGGSWQSAVFDAAGFERTVPSSDDASEAIGFRCAMSL
jgi:sulfatase modifying factor 1